MVKSAKSSVKLLLADDSVTMHRAVSLGLKKEPFEILYCDNGQDALRLVREHRPIIVLADLDMPGLTGAELCQTIKNDPELADTKVILLCGSFDQIDEKEVEKIPADARLWKPFESHVLVSMINTLLKISPKQSADMTEQMPRPPQSTTQTLQKPAEPTADIDQQTNTPAISQEETYVDNSFLEAPIIEDRNEATAQMPSSNDSLTSVEKELFEDNRITPPPPPPPPPTRAKEKSHSISNEDLLDQDLWGSDSRPQNTKPVSESPMNAFREETIDESSTANIIEEAETSLSNDFEIVGAPNEHTGQHSMFTEQVNSSQSEHTESFEGFASEHNASSNAISESQIRDLIKEEVQKAMNGYMKDALEQRLRDVITMIEKSSKS